MSIVYINLTKDKALELTNLWNKEIGGSFPLREELFYQNSFEDVNVLLEGSWIAVDEKNQNAAGFVISKVWKEDMECIKSKKDIGHIQVLLVASEYRNKGIGSELLKRSENSLREARVKTILLGQDPWHYFPGIPSEFELTEKWFKKRGYVKYGEEYDMYCNLAATKPLELPSFPDVKFRMLDKEEKEDFLAFLNRCFPGRWEYEAIHYFQRGGTGREFVVAEKKGQIIGFCRINDSRSPLIAQNVYWAPLFGNEELGGIGPLGIDGNERGHGYGLAIVQAGMYFLYKRGIKNLVIDWTGLVDFYGKLGCKVWKKYIKYKKELNN
ncbi:MAG TPA: GNAT family N-acetyltransferase [Clostridia bacterium]|nr:GNAT family N-acetyltransferase [Clostridia bacterium]